MKNYKNILLKETSSIKEALKVIDSGAMQIALIIDQDEKLLGTLTDGDIRRGILNNLSLEDSIESLYFREPTLCTIGHPREKILALAVEKKLQHIPIVNNDGVIVGLERVEELLQPQQKKQKVVLMVGGLGTRLRPLTETIPKPMLKVGDKPILETIILNFKKYGFSEFILSLGYKGEIIKEYFGDGERFGVHVEYIHEDKRMGTAGALTLMHKSLSADFFVMNGDLLTNINFEHMLEYHLKHTSMATMGVREYDFQVPYGVVKVDDIDIKSIEEKPTHKFFVSSGVYVLNKSLLSLIPKDTFYDMPTLFESAISKKLKTISFAIHDYWLDIGRIEEFKQANDEFKEVYE